MRLRAVFLAVCFAAVALAYATLFAHLGDTGGHSYGGALLRSSCVMVTVASAAACVAAHLRRAPSGWAGFIVTCVVSGIVIGASLVPLLLTDLHGSNEWIGLAFAGAFGGGMYAIPMATPFLLIFALDRTAASMRTGSLLERAFTRRVVTRAAAWVALLTCPTAMLSVSMRPVALVVCVVATIVTASGVVANLRRRRELESALKGLTYVDSQHGDAARDVLDVGMGDEVFAQFEPVGATYRHDSLITRAVKGAAYAALSRLATASVVDGFWTLAAVGATALALHERPSPPLAAVAPPAPAVAPPPATVSTDVHTGLAWWPLAGPILVDINGDGVDDIIGLRWDSAHEDQALVVAATDGKTLRPIWRAPALRNQWNNPRTRLVRAGNTLFLSDSEGALHAYDLRTGSVVASHEIEVGAVMQCAGPGETVWLASSKGGHLSDAWGHAVAGKEPAPCIRPDTERPCDTPGEGACRRWGDLPMGAPYALEEDRVGVAVGRDDIAGYWIARPRTPLWRAHLTLQEDDELHGFPQLHVSLASGRFVEMYQLESGRWHLGARRADTGTVLWVREPPRALHGTDAEVMTVTKDRVYVVMSSRLEVFEAATGESVGVVW